MVRKVGIAVFVLLVVTGFLVYRNRQLQQQPIKSPAISKTTDTDEWKTYNKESVNFGSFSIRYPIDWSIKENQTQDIGREQLTLQLSKAGYIIEISAFLDGWSPSGCNFDKTNKNQPQIGDYDDYIDIKNPSLILRRALLASESEDTFLWTICAKESSGNSYATDLPFSGYVGYIAPINFEETVLSEMDQILSTLRVAD